MPFSPSKCFSNWNNHGFEAKIYDRERVFSGKVNLIGECHKEDEISVGAQLCSELITDGNLSFWQRNLQSAVVLYCNGGSSCSQHGAVGCLLLFLCWATKSRFLPSAALWAGLEPQSWVWKMPSSAPWLIVELYLRLLLYPINGHELKELEMSKAHRFFLKCTKGFSSGKHPCLGGFFRHRRYFLFSYPIPSRQMNGDTKWTYIWRKDSWTNSNWSTFTLKSTRA